MSEPIRLTTPLTQDKVRSLHIGDRVLISGTIYAARDAAHKRMVETLDRGEPLPVDLRDQIVYYVGPSPAKPGQAIGSAGPTTSGRMDAYAPRLMEKGLSGMIGKGNRSQVGTMYSTAKKGVRYLEMTDGYVTRLALDKDDQVIGYEFINFGKMMDFIKGGMSTDDAFKKAQGHYGRFEKADGAVKYIDPRKQ